MDQLPDGARPGARSRQIGMNEDAWTITVPVALGISGKQFYLKGINWSRSLYHWKSFLPLASKGLTGP